MIKVAVRNRENEIILETNKILDLVAYIVGINENGGRLLDIRVYEGSYRIYRQSFNSLYIKGKEGLEAFIEDIVKTVYPHSPSAVNEFRKELEALR